MKWSILVTKLNVPLAESTVSYLLVQNANYWYKGNIKNYFFWLGTGYITCFHYRVGKWKCPCENVLTSLINTLWHNKSYKYSNTLIKNTIGSPVSKWHITDDSFEVVITQNSKIGVFPPLDSKIKLLSIQWSLLLFCKWQIQIINIFTAEISISIYL